MKYPYELENREVVVGMKNIPVKSSGYELLDKETGEVRDLVYNVRQPVYLDGTGFVKLYDPMVLMELGMTEWKVLMYMFMYLRYGGDIDFDVQRCIECSGLSRSSVYRGLSGLESRDVIKKVGGLYYINWNIAFKGNRDKINEKGI